MSRLLALVFGLTLVAPAMAQNHPDVSPDAVDAAFGYIRAQGATRGLVVDDVTELSVSDGHTSTRSGLTHVYVRQQLDGLDIIGTQMTVAVGRDGRVVYSAGDLIAGLSATADADGSNRAASLSAETALRAAAGHARILLGSVSTGSVKGGTAQETRFEAEGLSSPATARQVYVQTEGHALRRAWEVTLDDAASAHWWVIQVDAVTGAELGRYDLTVSESFGESRVSFAPVASSSGRSPLLESNALVGDVLVGSALVPSYKVYPMPFASPLYVAAPPPADGRTTVSGVEDALASPYGWHDTNGTAGAEYTTTRGNNTHTYIDRDDNELPDATYPAPDGGAGLSFVFPIDFTQAPDTYTSASATNLFYWSNIIHDVVYGYGFTEAAGNFQTSNYGRGGFGNDAVDSEVQSGADICNDITANGPPCLNNANFGTPPDGNRPRMQMYVGSNPNPDVDGSLDAHVVVHEYGHGISSRLVGGSSAPNCLGNAEQMGEGWSDWYANMLTMRTGDTRTTLRPVGNYLFGQTTAGGGIRPTPYSTDFAVNNYTYQRSRTLVGPHDIGFVWATILWEVTWDMIDAHGFSADLYNEAGGAGNQMMLNLITEGLKLTPCNPGFVSGRDAILAADRALYPDAANPGKGLHYTRLWTAFARRGLGYSASQGLTSQNTDNTEAFDMPPPSAVASITPASVSAVVAPNGTRTATVTVANTAAAGSANLGFTASLDGATQVRPASGSPVAQAEAVARASSAVPVVTPWTTDAPGVAVHPMSPLTRPTGSAPEARTTSAATAVVDCASGQMLNQEAATSAIGSTLTQKSGQSFTAPCSGLLSVITPFINYNGGPNTVWGATMRVYQGAGTTGTLLGSSAFSATNGAANGGGYLSVPLATPVRVAQGQVYTWFMDMTSGSTSIQFTNTSVYAGGQMYITTNGNPTNAQPYDWDMQARLTFAPPVVSWVRLSTTGGSVAPGSSQAITVTFDATGLTEGTYTASLIITTDAPATPSVAIPVTLTVGGQATVAGAAGWRFLSAPAADITVDDLAAMNLVQGVPGYYPTFGTNLYTGYTGSAYVASGGTGTTLELGRGFWWQFYNQNITPGGGSNSYALPTTIATTRPATTTDVPVTLHASGDRFNMLGNPFGTSLSLTGVGSWPGASTRLASYVAQIWDANARTYDVSAAYPTVSPWQGFFVEASAAGTLTIPASARTAGGVLERTDPAPLVAFTLAQADGPLQDRAAVLTFPEEATVGPDVADAAKLLPMADVYVTAALGGVDADGAAVLRAVESRPAPMDAGVEIPLHVGSVGAGSRLVLSWPLVEAIPDGWTMTLTDLATGQTTDLRTAESYAFDVEPEAARGLVAQPAARATATGTPRFVVTVTPRGAVSGESGPTAVLALDAPRPNPASESATVGYVLAEAGDVRLSVVDLLGREVAVLEAGVSLPVRTRPGWMRRGCHRASTWCAWRLEGNS